MEQQIKAKAEQLIRQLRFSGFNTDQPIFNGYSGTATVDIKECFDGIWQSGVEVSSSGYMIYRKLIQPLLDENFGPDSDTVIDFVTPSMSSVIGYVSGLSKLSGVE